MRYPFMRNQLLSFLLVVCLVYSCKKEEETKPYEPIQRNPDLSRNIDSINKYIQGTWEWKEELRVSWDGIRYLTPQTPGMHHDYLKLSNDTARFFRDNKYDSVYKFRIQRELEITNYPTDSMWVIVYYSFYTGLRRSYVPILISKNQLLMQHQFVSSIVGENIWVRK